MFTQVSISSILLMHTKTTKVCCPVQWVALINSYTIPSSQLWSGRDAIWLQASHPNILRWDGMGSAVCC